MNVNSIDITNAPASAAVTEPAHMETVKRKSFGDISFLRTDNSRSAELTREPYNNKSESPESHISNVSRDFDHAIYAKLPNRYKPPDTQQKHPNQAEKLNKLRHLKQAVSASTCSETAAIPMCIGTVQPIVLKAKTGLIPSKEPVKGESYESNNLELNGKEVNKKSLLKMPAIFNKDTSEHSFIKQVKRSNNPHLNDSLAFIQKSSNSESETARNTKANNKNHSLAGNNQQNKFFNKDGTPLYRNRIISDGISKTAELHTGSDKAELSKIKTGENLTSTKDSKFSAGFSNNGVKNPHLEIPNLKTATESANNKTEAEQILKSITAHSTKETKNKSDLNNTKSYDSSGSHTRSKAEPDDLVPLNNTQTTFSQQSQAFAHVIKANSNASDISSQRATDSVRDVINQITESIHNSLNQADKQLTIRLNPPELGMVVIKFQQSADGVLTGLLEVSKTQTRYDIEQVLPQVMRNLTECGVQLRRLDVSAGGDGLNQRQSASDGSEPGPGHLQDGAFQQYYPSQGDNDENAAGWKVYQWLSGSQKEIGWENFEPSGFGRLSSLHTLRDHQSINMLA